MKLSAYMTEKINPSRVLINTTNISLFITFQVSRLHSTSARVWCQKYIPHLIRESILHHVGKEIDTPSSSKLSIDSNTKSHKFVKFWSILYNSQQMHTLRLPCDLDAKSRGTLVSYLGSGFNVAESYVPTLGQLGCI